MVQKKLLLFLIIAFSLIIVLSTFFIFIKTSEDSPISIFNDISEVECLNIKSTDMLNDKYIENLSYEKAYIGTVEYKSYTFDIFAYEFKSAQAAKEYYNNYFELDIKKEYCYNFSSGPSQSHGIVMNGKNLYRINCNTIRLNDAKNYLASIFTLVYVSKEGFIENNRSEQATSISVNEQLN